LDYLTLDRASQTLSGGEGQRIRLATQIGSQLRGVLYVLGRTVDRLASAR
jgi:excinuclease ABC subunit A